MPNFEPLFRASTDNSIFYNEVHLIRYDRFPLKDKETLVCSIESAIKDPNKSEGFCIDITGYAEINGKILKKGKGVRLHFWQNNSPSEFKIKIHTKESFVWIYNVCEIENQYSVSDSQGNLIQKKSKSLIYGINGAAMIVEEIENGRRYRCSDISSIEKPFPFNDIVFTVKKLES